MSNASTSNTETSGRRRILVVGCGAMGGIFAAHLARVSDVVALDANRPHVDAMETNGLTIEGEGGFTSRLRACSDPAALRGERFDAVLFLVKSGQTAAAAEALKPVLQGHPLMVTLQNGMGNTEALCAAIAGPVARGVALDAGRYVAPGRVQHLVRGNTTWIGPVRGTPEDSAWLADLLTAAGLPARSLADPMDAVWPKFVFNCVMNPVGALLAGVNAARYQSPEIVQLIDDLAEECCEVARALGARFEFDPLEMVKATRAGQRPITSHAGSMALDIGRGVPTEIEELTGFIVREGRRLGISVVRCETIYRLVKGLELARAWQLQHPAVT